MVLNLSDTKLWVETFGLTVLEAMAYGLPTIVPPVGGVVELVEEGKNGFLIDSKNVKLISEKLNQMLQNETIYHQMSKEALEKVNSLVKIILKTNQYEFCPINEIVPKIGIFKVV